MTKYDVIEWMSKLKSVSNYFSDSLDLLENDLDTVLFFIYRPIGKMITTDIGLTEESKPCSMFLCFPFRTSHLPWTPKIAKKKELKS